MSAKILEITLDVRKTLIDIILIPYGKQNMYQENDNYFRVTKNTRI